MSSRVRAFAVGLVLTVLLVSHPGFTQDDKPLPRFEDYLVTTHYTGKTAQPILKDQTDRQFRTRLRYAAKQKPNFAGRYVFNAFGCGAQCLSGFLLEAKTGKVIWVPFLICCWGDDVERPIEFKLDSSLMIFKGSRGEQGGGTYYYNFDGKQFVLVRSIETGMPAQNQ